MVRPLYNIDQKKITRPSSEGHHGLWFERFFDGFPVGWRPEESAETKKQWTANKEKWVGFFHQQYVGNTTDCQNACLRQRELCERLKGATQAYTGTWRLVTGMGLPHPAENGFLWHPTLGTPYLPGSTVKGLVRTWVEAWGTLGSSNLDETLYRWFGSESKDPQELTSEKRQARHFIPPTGGDPSKQDTEAGGFIFFDALPTASVRLVVDVMTPHQGEWYAQGDTPINLDKEIPADWHNPVPVQFLVTHRPTLQFAVAPRTSVAVEELDQVMNALEQGLDWLGAGAKTAVGYGQMEPNEKVEKESQNLLYELTKKRDAVEAQRQQRLDRQAELAAMDEFDRMITEFLDKRPNQTEPEHSALISGLKGDRWQGREREEIIRRLKQRMQKDGKWKPESKKKNPHKDKEYQQTLIVIEWLKEIN